MVADISKPDIETRIAILRAKLQERGFLVETGVLQEIAESIDTNVRELEAVLKQVMDESELMQVDPSVNLVRNIIKRLFPSKLKQKKYSTLDAETIISVVSEHFNVTPADIIGDSRKKEVTTPRHIAMYLIRESLGESLESIGDIFGGKNHTTVMHSITKAKSIVSNDMSIVKLFNKIKNDLGL
jgi:chromosomal replication initiator protein